MEMALLKLIYLNLEIGLVETDLFKSGNGLVETDLYED